MKKHKSYQSFSAFHTMKEKEKLHNHLSVGEDHEHFKSQQTNPSRWTKRHRRAKSMSPMLEKKNQLGYLTLDNDGEDYEWNRMDGSFASAPSRKNTALSPIIMKSKALDHIEQFKIPQKVEKIEGPKKIHKNSSGSDSEGTVSTKLCNSQSDSLLSFTGSDVQQKESSKSTGSFFSRTESDENYKVQIGQNFGVLLPPSGSDTELKELPKEVMTEPKSKTFDDIVGMITAAPSPSEAETKMERPLKHIVATPSEEARMHTLLNDDSVSNDRQKWWEEGKSRKKKHGGSTDPGIGTIFMDMINSILDGFQALGLCTDDEDKFRIGGEIHIDPDEQSHVIDDITFDQSFARQRRWRSDI